MNDKLYSEADVQLLIEKEVTKQRLGDMERMITDGERRSSVAFAEIKMQIGSLTTLVEKQGATMETANDALREEIKKDYATKPEVAAYFDKLNTKIDTNWAKLVLIISTISFLVILVQVGLRIFKIG